MKRNVFGALLVAGGLALWTSVASLANDTTPTAAPDAAIAELKAESTQPNVEKQDVGQQEVDKAEKPEVEKADKAEQPEVRSTTREGND